MIVLSLFDGMACGLTALKRAGVPVTKYYASEIDKYAIQIAMKNHPEIIQLGDVSDWEFWDIDKPDLIIGGSPCQGFSFAGKQLAFDDPRSALFFTMMDIIVHYQPRYKMLENVKMKKDYLDVISSYMGVEPVFINSALVSAQNRQRYYWANWDFDVPEDKGIVFNDIKCSDIDDSLFIPEKYTFILKKDVLGKHNTTVRLGGYKGQGQGQRVYSMNGKSACLSALGGGWGAKTGLYLEGKKVRKPSKVELERLQTLPDGYTKAVGYTHAAKMLGNGWTVDVIAHIFSHINK
jgi:site-specific DNA-cytosine methylase